MSGERFPHMHLFIITWLTISYFGLTVGNVILFVHYSALVTITMDVCLHVNKETAKEVFYKAKLRII